MQLLMEFMEQKERRRPDPAPMWEELEEEARAIALDRLTRIMTHMLEEAHPAWASSGTGGGNE